MRFFCKPSGTVRTGALFFVLVQFIIFSIEDNAWVW